MRRVGLSTIQKIAAASADDIWAAARKYGRDAKIVVHWSAGKYDQCFVDYHINVTGDGLFYISVEDFSEVLSHTEMRNSGCIGISLCCCYYADTEELGDYPPTKNQIESMAKAIAVVADALDIPIDKQHVLTHGEAADNEDGYYADEPYGPKNGCERWDLEYLGTDESPGYNPYATDGSRGGDVLRGKAVWYRENGIEEDQLCSLEKLLTQPGKAVELNVLDGMVRISM